MCDHDDLVQEAGDLHTHPSSHITFFLMVTEFRSGINVVIAGDESTTALILRRHRTYAHRRLQTQDSTVEELSLRTAMTMTTMPGRDSPERS